MGNNFKKREVTAKMTFLEILVSYDDDFIKVINENVNGTNYYVYYFIKQGKEPKEFLRTPNYYGQFPQKSKINHHLVDWLITQEKIKGDL